MLIPSQAAESPGQRPFGKGPAVSLFTLGTMRALAGPSQLQEVLEAALAIGINHLETAPAYGQSEYYLGLAIKRLGIKPKQLVITSKILPSMNLAAAKEQLHRSLERLSISHPNNLAVHGLHPQPHLAWAI